MYQAEKYGQNLPVAEAVKNFVLEVEQLGMPSQCDPSCTKCVAPVTNQFLKTTFGKINIPPQPVQFVYYSVLQDSDEFLGNQVNYCKMDHSEA